MSFSRRLRWLPAVLCGLVLATGTPIAASAQWHSTKTARTGVLRMAAPAYQFSGPAPASFTIAYTVINFVDTAYPVLTNTGTTPASFAGPVLSTGGLPLGSAVAVKSCTTAWVLGACPGTETTLLPATWLSIVPTVRYQNAPVPAGGRVYLQVKVGGFLATATVTLTVTSKVLPAGGANRTAG